MLTQARLRELFSYDRNAGCLIRLVNRPRAPKGSKAVSVAFDGYSQTSVDGKTYSTHRLIWMFHNGEWPRGTVDHINHNRLDNRIENLRDVTIKQNCNNKRPVGVRTPISGVKEVSPGVFQASVRLDRKFKIVGVFKTIPAAVAAKRKAEDAFLNGLADHEKSSHGDAYKCARIVCGVGK